MKKFITILFFAFALTTGAQNTWNAASVFKNDVTFDSLKYGSTTIVNKTILKDTLRYTPRAGAGKILQSDAIGNARWTDTLTGSFNYIGTPVFNSGIKTDTVKTITPSTTGYVLTLVNDSTGIFAPPTGGSNAWSLDGNPNIDASSQYAGTSDANDFVLKANAIERLRALGTQSRVNITSDYFYIYDDAPLYGTSKLALEPNGYCILGGQNIGDPNINTDPYNHNVNTSTYLMIRDSMQIEYSDGFIGSTLSESRLKWTLSANGDSLQIKDTPISIVDGTQADGYILTSDAYGLASWQPNAATGLNLQQVTDNGNNTTNAIQLSVLSVYDGENEAYHTFNCGGNNWSFGNQNSNSIFALSPQFLTFSQTLNIPDTSGTIAMSVNGILADEKGNIDITAVLLTLPSYANDAAAATGGVPVGGSYYNTTLHVYTRREI